MAQCRSNLNTTKRKKTTCNPNYINQTVDATVASINQYPEFSSTACLKPDAAELGSDCTPASVVSFGRVPLMMSVFVPFTGAI